MIRHRASAAAEFNRMIARNERDAQCVKGFWNKNALKNAVVMHEVVVGD